MRTLEDKQMTALDTLAWITMLPQDEDTTLFRILLETLIADYHRVQSKQPISESHRYALVRCQALTAVLMAEHLDDHAQAIEGYVIDSVPANAEQLIQAVLLDALYRFTSSLTAGERTEDFTPNDSLTNAIRK